MTGKRHGWLHICISWSGGSRKFTLPVWKHGPCCFGGGLQADAVIGAEGRAGAGLRTTMGRTGSRMLPGGGVGVGVGVGVRAGVGGPFGGDDLGEGQHARARGLGRHRRRRWVRRRHGILRLVGSAGGPGQLCAGARRAFTVHRRGRVGLPPLPLGCESRRVHPSSGLRKMTLKPATPPTWAGTARFGARHAMVRMDG